MHCDDFDGGITCNVLEDPIMSLLLPDVWNDIMVSCLSASLTHSSGGTQGR